MFHLPLWAEDTSFVENSYRRLNLEITIIICVGIKASMNFSNDSRTLSLDVFLKDDIRAQRPSGVFLCYEGLILSSIMVLIRDVA